VVRHWQNHFATAVRIGGNERTPRRKDSTNMRTTLAALGLGLVALAGTACSSDSTPAAAPAPQSSSTSGSSTAAAPAGGSGTADAPVQAAIEVTASRTPLGTILTDSAGHTLYALTTDKGGNSSCTTQQCLATWPPAVSVAAPRAGAGIDAGLLHTTSRDQGTVQAAYGDWPLYFWAGDVQPNEWGGQGTNDIWWVVDATTGKLIKKTS
jgi:predicted lipoprotein with Yx(FWY)xxD motif